MNMMIWILNMHWGHNVIEVVYWEKSDVNLSLNTQCYRLYDQIGADQFYGQFVITFYILYNLENSKKSKILIETSKISRDD